MAYRDIIWRYIARNWGMGGYMTMCDEVVSWYIPTYCAPPSDSNVLWYIALYYGVSWYYMEIYSDKPWYGGVYGAVWWGHIAIYRDIQWPHPPDSDILWYAVLYYGLSWHYMEIYRDKLGYGGYMALCDEIILRYIATYSDPTPQIPI